jgi:hypothetical protein
MRDFDVPDKHMDIISYTTEGELTNSDVTYEAIKEGRELLANPSAPRYSNMDELKVALEE